MMETSPAHASDAFIQGVNVVHLTAFCKSFRCWGSLLAGKEKQHRHKGISLTAIRVDGRERVRSLWLERL